MGYKISGQVSGMCRAAYSKVYGYPTKDENDARIDAQRAADTWNEPVVLLSDDLQKIAEFFPK